MSVKELPLVWRKFPAEFVTLEEGGAVARQMHSGSYEHTLTTSGIELTEGKHYWEVELLTEDVSHIFIGIGRASLYTAGFCNRGCTDGWFMHAGYGGLHGNGKQFDDKAGGYEPGDRVGVLLDLNDGSLHFFKNGAQHDPGYPAGSVTGPVAHAVQMYNNLDSVRLLPDAKAPTIR
jgi:hypothetical protein